MGVDVPLGHRVLQPDQISMFDLKSINLELKIEVFGILGILGCDTHLGK